jgi:predicted nucleotidyltransferase
MDFVAGRPPMDLTEQQVRYIQEWAERAGVVETVRLYGSRAKGIARSDSDVNLALTVGTSHYVRFLNEWQKGAVRRAHLEGHVEAIQFPGRRHRPPLLRRVQRGAVPEISGRLN